MSDLLFILLIISFIGLIVGIIKPSAIKMPSRKTSVKTLGTSTLILFFVFGLTAPKVPANQITSPSEQVAQESQQIPETNTPSTPANAPQVAVSISNETKRQSYKVLGVVDGDTFKVDINGTETAIRLIGIDTPETVDPRKTVQCFGKEASARAKELLTNKEVYLESDPTQGDRDKYNRPLRYAFFTDGTFFNKLMIRDGYAHEYTYNIPYKYQQEFKDAEKYAREHQLGLWSPNTCNGITTTSAAITTTNPVVTQPATNNQQAQGHSFYTSSYSRSKYYYCDTDDGWKGLSEDNLRKFSSEADLLKAYSTRILHEPCK